MSESLAALRSKPELRDLPAPPPELTPDSFASRLYGMLAPIAQADPDFGWSLLIYLNALGQMFQLLEDIERDTPDGPGWSALLDLDRCPDYALPWLAQFVGVRIPGGLTEQEQRDWIASTDGFRRGSVQAMIGACKATLSGTQTVLFRERSGGPTTAPAYAYYLSVFTYTSETPNPTATQAALLAQKPAGLVLVYAAVAAGTYAAVKGSYATYAAVKAAFATYSGLLTNSPGH
jgi:hypothetical protein